MAELYRKSLNARAQRRRLLAISSSALIAILPAILPTIAKAQTSGAPSTADAPGDIVVTAQRDRQLASKTPIAITAIKGDDLMAKGANDPLKLANEVPNLEVNRFYGLQITIRGVTSSNMFAQGDPSAAFLLDGVYIARPQEQEASFFDVDRVEVLRGPQGTLYGRNTTAGLINVISKRPTDTFEAYANVGYGNYNAWQADGAINLPVREGVAFRIAGTYDRRNSYFINAPGDTINSNPFRDNKSVRLSGKFDFTDKISLFLTGDYSSMTGINQIVVDGSAYYDMSDPANPLYKGGNASQLLQRGYTQLINPYVNDKIYGVTGELTWNLGRVTATYVGSYRRFDQHEDINDLSGQVSPTYIRGTFEQNSQELRFALNDVARLKLQVGAMYFREVSKQHFDQPDYFGYDHFILDYNPTKSTSYAFFGQGTYSLTDALHLTAGVRYSHDAKSQLGWTITQSSVYGDDQYLNAARTAFSKVTWRVAADYDIDNRNMVYASVATGYKAGSFNDGCEEGVVINGYTCNLPRSRGQLYYNPENITAYEIGLKGHLAGNVLRYDLAAFYYDYRDLQVGSVTYYAGAATSLTQNAARARVKGIEAALTVQPSPRNLLSLSLNYLDAHYVSYQPDPAGPDYAGYPLARSPKVTASADYTYTLPLASGASLALNGRIKLSSQYFLVDSTSGASFRQPSYTRTDLSLTYNAPGNRWYVQGYARNLENKVLVTGMLYFAGVMSIIPSDPRTYGVRAGVKF
ncbi:MAG TPA: TonB-dependent receptor [Novosphingobium sp.]|nr:TonB-dependent receptor [Novosphingobium sp.]